MSKGGADLARLCDEEARAFGEGHATFEAKPGSVEESPHLGLCPLVSRAAKDEHLEVEQTC